MNKLLTKKELSDLDKVYGRLKNYASTDEKLRYCQSLLTRMESFSSTNEIATDHIMHYSREIIQVTRYEIEELLKQQKSR